MNARQGSAATPSCQRYCSVAELLDKAIYCAQFHDADAWDREADWARWGVRMRGDRDWPAYTTGVPWIPAREYVLFADALERKDHKALAVQIRRLAGRARDEAFAVADALGAA